ncbi:MAG: insulinase family protein [Chloroflexi bacterium]|nr:insulinase family protein [Chloroflexota bacterium]
MNQVVQSTQLPNGLTILTREIHTAPVATFWVWYRVGARNEVPGITGISHWVEHMLFKGTPTLGKGEVFRTVSKNGGTLNGFTWLDFTAYFETLPADRIGLAIRIESDRMADSLFDPAEVASERTVIISEREGSENYPTFHLGDEVNAAAFKVHPYGQGVIGARCDLLSMTRDDLYGYYQTHYAPNNAVVVAVGDFATSDLLRQVEDAFGPIPPGPEPRPVRSVEPPQQGERRVVVQRPGPTAYFEVAYHIPAASDPDIVPLIVLDGILSGAKPMGLSSGHGGFGRSARLYRALVDSGLCSSAESAFALTRDPYLLSVTASLRPGTELARVEGVVDAEVTRLRNGDISDQDIAKALKQVRAQLVYAAEGVTNQAYWLGSLEMVASHRLLDEMIDRIGQVTREDVQRVAETYLAERNRTVGWFVPEGGPAGAGPAGPAPLGSYHEVFPGSGDTPDSVLSTQYSVLSTASAYRPAFFSDGAAAGSPALPAQRAVTANGIVVLGVENRVTPAVIVRGYLPAGSLVEPTDKIGLAVFAARMLHRGTARYSFEEMNELTDGLGASISVEGHLHTASVSLRCLREDFPRMLDLLAELLRYPTFPVEQIEKLRGQVLAHIREQHNDTRSMAVKRFAELTYPPGHPYHYWRTGDEATVGSLTREDMVRFHELYYQPAGLVLAVVGDALFEEAVGEVSRALGDWSAVRPPAPLDAPDASSVPGVIREHVPIPGKSQTNVVLGRPAIPRSHPDYYALNTADLILGGLGLMGRLGARVRDEQGLAYHVHSDFDAARGPAAWTVQAGVNPRNVDRAIESIRDEVRRIREHLVDEEELADAKSYLTGALPLSVETSGGIARILQRIELFNLGLDYLDHYPAIIDSLTREQLWEAAHRWFSADEIVITTAGPEAPP